MHGSAGVETVCEVYRYSFQAGKRCCFVALRNWKGPCTGIGTAFLLSLLGVEEDVIYEDYSAHKPLYGAQTGIYAETCTDLAGGR